MRALFVGPFDERSHSKGGGERYALVLRKYLERMGEVAFASDAEAATMDLSAFDVVQVGIVPDLVARMQRHRPATKLVLTFHNSPLGNARHGWETGRRGLYRLGQLAMYAKDLASTSWMVARADAVACVSECTRADMRRQNPWAKGKMYFNENGVDTEVFHAEGARDDGFVLFAGRLEKVKGVDMLVRALSGTRHRVVVIGSGRLDADLRKAAGSNVEFLGAVADDVLVDHYRRASVAVFPSLFEGYGLVALESLACGTPTAISDGFCIRGPAADLVRVFPRNDPVALRRVVDELVGTKTPEWSRKAADVLARHHGIERQASGLMALYRSLAAGEGVPEPALR